MHQELLVPGVVLPEALPIWPRILLYDLIKVTSFENNVVVIGWISDFPLDETKFSIIGFSEEIPEEDVRLDWEIEDSIQVEHNVLRPWYHLAQAITSRPGDRLN
jgi:hypothetical protein